MIKIKNYKYINNVSCNMFKEKIKLIMRIDLHTHTKKTKKGEPNTRNITPEKFKEIMKEAEIGIVAITNHDYFDLKEYEKFIDENNYILLPGVEISIDINKSIKHLNIIFAPKKAKKLEQILKNEKNWNLEKLKIFDFEDTIFYLDYKNSKRNFEEQDYQDLNKIIKNGKIICDANNAKTNRILSANNFLSLIGSDVKDWDKYLELNVPKLLNTQLKIESYETFIKTLHEDEKVLKTLFSKIEKEKINFCKNEEIELKNLFLIRGINILFGDKATGKSLILKLIKKNLEIKNKKVKIYTSNSYSNYYDDMLKDESIDKNEIFEKIEEKIKEILNFKDLNFKNFKDFFLSEEQQHKKIFKIQETIMPNISKPDDIFLKDAKENYKDFIAKLKEAKKFKEYSVLLKHKEILNKLWNDYISNIKKFKLFELKKNIQKDIRQILITEKDVVSSPTIINLLKKWNERNKLLKNIKDLKNLSFDKQEVLEEFNILENKKIELIKNSFSFPFGKEYDVSKKLKYKKITKEYNKKFHPIFIKKNINIFSSPEIWISTARKYFDEILDQDIKKNIFCFSKKTFSCKENKNYKPSNGEKAFIVLMTILNKKEIDFFLLDEPSTYFSAKTITKELLPKLKELKNKFIVIATHKGTMGVNTIPLNYIYREVINKKNEYKTYVANFFSKNLIDVENKENKINLKETILNNFEGDKKELIYRISIYGINKENENKSSFKRI